ncbi:hypothetical protein TRVA0_006S03774 [Trichomonascus vanleenenianus]|uniref:uncharacterized protein n=1 Tax=Trichomonascus vanleenenianus TaxID=2268995 RepID=UPI003ECA5387
MYHVRFLKVPSCRRKNGQYELKFVIAITNDLGNDIFYGECDVAVTVEGDRGAAATATGKWKPGTRALPISVSFDSNQSKEVVVSVSVDQKTVEDHLYDDTDRRAKYFLPLFSPKLRLPKPQEKDWTSCEKVALRKLPGLEMFEETGESIARHLWDAGIILSRKVTQDNNYLGFKPKRVIELGTGCGIVGLTLNNIFNAEVLLTDLEESEEICQRNINHNRGNSKAKPPAKFQLLDWETPNVTGNYDLVIATDCTYNTDSYGVLLGAIEQLAGPETIIVVADKYRDEREEDFFDRFRSKFSVVSDEQLTMHGETVRIIKGTPK